MKIPLSLIILRGYFISIVKLINKLKSKKYWLNLNGRFNLHNNKIKYTVISLYRPNFL